MSTITVVALAKFKPGTEDAAVAAFTKAIEQTHTEEGCINYALHRSNTDPQQYVVVERWADQAALDAHFQQPWMGTLFSDLADYLVEPPAIHFLAPLPIGDPVKGAL